MNTQKKATGTVACRIMLHGRRTLLCLPRAEFFATLRQLLPALR